MTSLVIFVCFRCFVNNYVFLLRYAGVILSTGYENIILLFSFHLNKYLITHSCVSFRGNKRLQRTTLRMTAWDLAAGAVPTLRFESSSVISSTFNCPLCVWFLSDAVWSVIYSNDSLDRCINCGQDASRRRTSSKGVQTLSLTSRISFFWSLFGAFFSLKDANI